MTEDAMFSDVDRADVLFRLGACRVEISSIQTAVGLLNEALTLAERSELPRIVCVPRSCACARGATGASATTRPRATPSALELSEGLDDCAPSPASTSRLLLVAERQGQWVLARKYAEQAKAQFEEIADRATVGKILNNLGGLNFLLGKPEEAIEHLNESFKLLLEYGSEADAAAPSTHWRRSISARARSSPRRSRRARR